VVRELKDALKKKQSTPPAAGSGANLFTKKIAAMKAPAPVTAKAAENVQPAVQPKKTSPAAIAAMALPLLFLL
jgi:hypothetical protein